MSSHTNTFNPFMRNAQAEYFAKNPDEFKKLLDQRQTAARRQGALRLGAGALDFFGGRRDMKQAESDLEELGGQADAIRQELGEMRAPGSMDPSTVAEATRNAAILGFQTPDEDPADDLAAQAMALEGGADPSKLYAAAMKQESAEDAQARQEAKSTFNQGLQMAQTDALNRFKQDYQQKAGELDDLNQQIAGAEGALAQAELRKQRGAAGAIQGGSQFAQYGGIDDIRRRLKDVNLGGEPSTDPVPETPFVPENQQIQIDPSQQGAEVVTPEVGSDQGQQVVGIETEQNPYGFSAGGAVQQTPGKYDHDTNDLILMAQGAGGTLIDTGIRQTGGEYVIDPFDAGNMRQAFDKIDPVEVEKVRTGRSKPTPRLIQDLMQMYDAVRFVNEPQFADDYYEKKMNGHA